MNDIKKYELPSIDSSIRQGEILTNVIQYKPDLELVSNFEELSNFVAIQHSFVIIVTQDCDLDWDYRARQKKENQSSKLLNSVFL